MYRYKLIIVLCGNTIYSDQPKANTIFTVITQTLTVSTQFTQLPQDRSKTVFPHNNFEFSNNI